MIGLIGFAILIGAALSGRFARRAMVAAAIGWWGLAVLTTLPPWLRAGNAALLGGDVVGWLALGGFAVLVFGYKSVLDRVKSRIAATRKVEEAPVRSSAFRPAEL